MSAHTDDPAPPGGVGSTTLTPAQMAEILAVAEDGIVTVNARQEIVLFNHGAARIFGYEPGEVLGRHLDVLIPPSSRSVHHRYTEDFALGPATSRAMGERGTVVGVRKDGTQFPAEITISRQGSGAALLLTAIVRDAGARKRYEDALLRLNTELEERVRARTAELAERNLLLTQKTEENEMFVYSVSHDLRSPLVNLEGFSEEIHTAARDLARLCTDPRIPADIKAKADDLVTVGLGESVGFVRTAVGRLSRIIDALLRLSRAGRVEYRPQVVDVGAVARRVVSTLHQTAKEKGAVVTVEEMPLAWADPDAVEQVLANLVTNALSYLDPARPGRVEIGGRDAGPNSRLREFFVRDNGIGIPPAYLPKVFQAFQRLHPDKTPGEGIGLAIVRRVLGRLGGTVAAEPTPGGGTTFTFTLPAGVASGGEQS